MSWAPTEAQRNAVRVVVARVSEETGVSMTDLLGRRRSQIVMRARRRLYLEVWRMGYSLPEVGVLLGRDHTTILCGVRTALGLEGYRAEQERRSSPESRRVA